MSEPIERERDVRGVRVPTFLYGTAWKEERTRELVAEALEAGRVRLLGASNVTPDQVDELCDFARVEPAFVQNRCRARLGWDAAVREVCRARGIAYQAFSLLTANRRALEDDRIRRIADRHGRTVPQVIFRFALAAGMIPLTGTTDPEHMRQDLAVYEFDLTEDEVATIAGLHGRPGER